MQKKETKSNKSNELNIKLAKMLNIIFVKKKQ